MDDDIPEQLIKQRTRNRIMEVLAFFCETQCLHEIGADEIIESWFDFLDDDRLSWYDSPVFSRDEAEVIRHFHWLLDGKYLHIPGHSKAEEVGRNPAWIELSAAAREAVEVFNKRGRMDEKRLIPEENL